MFFSKMHGLKNDFMVVDAVTQKVCLSQKIIHKLSNRNSGIGFDQLLIIEPPHDPNIDFHYRIFNSDGIEVTQCGNGARCIALFLKKKKLINKNFVRISTKTNQMNLSFTKDNLVCVEMNEPIFDPKKIPFYTSNINSNYTITVKKQLLTFSVVSMGNPHCIVFVEDVKNTKVSLIGSILENHKRFPEKVNVGFMQILNRNNILLRVYERGVGETKSCGSNACAAVAAGIQNGKLDKNVKVNLLGGNLEVNWKGVGRSLFMIGPAVHIYDGKINL